MKIITIFEVWMVSPNTEINGFKNINDGETRNFFFHRLQPSKEHLADNQYHFHDDFYIAKRGNNIKRNKNSLIEFFESFGEKTGALKNKNLVLQIKHLLTNKHSWKYSFSTSENVKH